MHPPFDLVGLIDVHLEERTKPLCDDIHTLLIVQSAHVGLQKGIQMKSPYPRLGLGINDTLNTSALKRTISQTGIW